MFCAPNAGGWGWIPVRELDPACCNQDPVQPNKYIKLNLKKRKSQGKLGPQVGRGQTGGEGCFKIKQKSLNYLPQATGTHFRFLSTGRTFKPLLFF